MKSTVFAIAAILIGQAAFTDIAGAENVRTGKWQMTMTTRVGGAEGAEMQQALQEMNNMSPQERAMMESMMPNMAIGATGSGAPGLTMSLTQCLSDESPVPHAEDYDASQCRDSYRVNGSTVHFESVCPDGRSSGDVMYMGDTMHGTIHSVSTEGGQTSEATIDLTGQYLGPCE